MSQLNNDTDFPNKAPLDGNEKLIVVDDPAGTPAQGHATVDEIATRAGTALAGTFEASGAVATHAALTTTHGVSGNLVGTSDTQTLTNKTIGGQTNAVSANLVHVLIRNNSGAQIDKGSAVYASGYNVGADLVEVSLARADSSATMPAIGIAEANIANNATGQAVSGGVLDGLDTSSFSVTDTVYVSPTVAGALTSTKPTDAAHLIQALGKVLRSNPATGSLVVQGAGRTNDVPNAIAASKITSGTLTHERGGLEADVSAYSGLLKISGGATSQAAAGTDYAAASHVHAGEDVTSGTVAAARLGTMTGDAGAGGTSGAAPAPGAGDAAAGKFLKADATWAAPAGGIGGSTGATDNAILRADGTGGATAQGSAPTIDDSGNIEMGAASVLFNSGTIGFVYDGTNGGYPNEPAVRLSDGSTGTETLRIDKLFIDGGGGFYTFLGNAIKDTAGTGYANFGAKQHLAYDGSSNNKLILYPEAAVPRVGLSSDSQVAWESGTTTAYGTPDIGIARGAAGVLRISNGSTGIGAALSSVLVEANTAGVGSPNVLALTESGTVLTNEGATAENYHTLPTAVAGYQFTFVCQDTDGIRVVANTADTISLGGTVSASAGYIKSVVADSSVTLVAINATQWIATSIVGTWTVDS